MKIICVLFLVILSHVFAQDGLLQRTLLNAENQLRGGPLTSVQSHSRPSGPSYQTMVIYNEIMRQYYEVVKRYYDYKNRNISTAGIKNPEFRYFEEVLSKMSSSELRVLMGHFGQAGFAG